MNLVDLARSALPADLPVTELTAEHWAVHFADREPLEVILSEPMTHAAILARYPEAVAAEPVVRRSRPATDREAAELRLLVADVYDDPRDRAEALRAALADMEAALTCYRALAGRDPNGDGAMLPCLHASTTRPGCCNGFAPAHRKPSQCSMSTCSRALRP